MLVCVLQYILSGKTYVNRGSVWKGVILAQSAWQIILSKLTTSLIGTNPDELARSWVGVVGGRRAWLSDGRESSRRRVGVRAWHTLAVIVVNKAASVTRDASGRAAPVLASTLLPGSVLGQSEASEATKGEEIAHGVQFLLAKTLSECAELRVC
jgi:hypothetical protein